MQEIRQKRFEMLLSMHHKKTQKVDTSIASEKNASELLPFVFKEEMYLQAKNWFDQQVANAVDSLLLKGGDRSFIVHWEQYLKLKFGVPYGLVASSGILSDDLIPRHELEFLDTVVKKCREVFGLPLLLSTMVRKKESFADAVAISESVSAYGLYDEKRAGLTLCVRPLIEMLAKIGLVTCDQGMHEETTSSMWINTVVAALHYAKFSCLDKL